MPDTKIREALLSSIPADRRNRYESIPIEQLAVLVKEMDSKQSAITIETLKALQEMLKTTPLAERVGVNPMTFRTQVARAKPLTDGVAMAMWWAMQDFFYDAAGVVLMGRTDRQFVAADGTRYTLIAEPPPKQKRRK